MPGRGQDLEGVCQRAGLQVAIGDDQITRTRCCGILNRHVDERRGCVQPSGPVDDDAGTQLAEHAVEEVGSRHREL